MINVTASLQIRNGIYQAVLSYKKDGKWETKWKSTKIQAIKGNKKKAETKKEEIRQKFQEEINSDNIENEDMLFIDYMKHWLKMIKASKVITNVFSTKKRSSLCLTTSNFLDIFLDVIKNLIFFSANYCLVASSGIEPLTRRFSVFKLLCFLVLFKFN